MSIVFKEIRPEQRVNTEEAKRGRFEVSVEVRATYEVLAASDTRIWLVLRAMADLLEAEAGGGFETSH